MTLKRIFDVIFALSALAVSAPVLVGIALWIKLDSRGSILFQQERVGLRGRPFPIYKFRTMRSDPALQSLQITVEADPRITRAGKFLRRYKLDELPQFLNVLLGHMSVVGPRPEVPRYVELYPSEARELILSVRPGITDLASIVYRNEGADLASANNPEELYRREILPAKLEHCCRYVREQSFLLDLEIVWRTVVAIFADTQSNLGSIKTRK
ncbi:sugar transferase [Variovorax soli]|uniref:Lipopolysaccharide/colanic/teichoic acid biosynthesis glycosyltransferase n=1 Tax=Variovorax soli TaxID=376815 RepID=A0ABU1N8F5_9BURK|nr:sugar transferase [Variovorax soli]MDR6534725.1 lipopolysaccharide/colanic/teichoic acid biosynthesis glycosyltransferase [Variovorax soli]